MAPEITLDSETGIYTVKVGRALTIAPTVRYAENALFSWTSDGKLLSTEPMLTYTWDEAAEVYVTFTVQNENGKAEEELKVEVLEMAPPVISLALPSKGLKVLQNTDYVFTPDIQNSDLEGFRCEWLREGEVVAEGVTYTFNEAELGTYMVVCRASNVDGEATKEIPVEVVDELPYEVFFPTQSVFRTSTDRYAYIGTPIFLEPQLEYFDNPQFEWSVDGETVPDAAERMFRYTPTEAGEHIVRVTVREAKQRAERLTRNITRAETVLSAEVKVTCFDAAQEDRYRPATGGNSPLWNKVYEYTPAPGQFVGEMKTGGFDGTETTQEAAVAYAERRLKEKIWVSLGAFGGYSRGIRPQHSQTGDGGGRIRLHDSGQRFRRLVGAGYRLGHAGHQRERRARRRVVRTARKRHRQGGDDPELRRHLLPSRRQADGRAMDRFGG